MENRETMPEEIEVNEKTAVSDETEKAVENNGKQEGKGLTIALVAIGILFAFIIAGSIVLAFQSTVAVAAVRDIFIILMALMLVVIGVAMVILILQISNLINILKNDIKPMLDSGTDTINTLKGTVRFLSTNLTEPVIKLNESLAGLKRAGQLFKIFRD